MHLVGHGPFSEYSGEINCAEPAEIGSILEKLVIPQELGDNMIIVKDKRIIELAEIVDDEDTIHLFLTVHGG